MMRPKSISSLSVEAQGARKLNLIVECAQRSIPTQKCITLSVLAKKFPLPKPSLKDSYSEYQKFYASALDDILCSHGTEGQIMFLNDILKVRLISLISIAPRTRLPLPIQGERRTKKFERAYESFIQRSEGD